MRIGIDLGGTKIEGIVLDQKFQEQARLRLATPVKEGYEAVVNADDVGLQVALHAVGERATNLAIDVYERVNQEREVKDRRFRLEHAQHLLDTDLIRLAQLGILVNVQPSPLRCM